MTQHAFIVTPGKWVGEGKISFSASAEHIRFYTRWLVGEADQGNITCGQEVEMVGNEPNMMNQFVFSNVTATSFTVQLENDILGQVKGKGVIDAKAIAWEFHGGVLKDLKCIRCKIMATICFMRNMPLPINFALSSMGASGRS